MDIDDKVFFNFASTVENYNEIIKYLSENDNLNEDTVRIVNIYQTMLFLWSIDEVNKLRGIIRDQYFKSTLMSLQAERAKTLIDDLMNELTKANKQKEEPVEKKPSFIEKIKNKISKIFH